MHSKLKVNFKVKKFWHITNLNQTFKKQELAQLFKTTIIMCKILDTVVVYCKNNNNEPARLQKKKINK